VKEAKLKIAARKR